MKFIMLILFVNKNFCLILYKLHTNVIFITNLHNCNKYKKKKSPASPGYTSFLTSRLVKKKLTSDQKGPLKEVAFVTGFVPWMSHRLPVRESNGEDR